MQKVLGRQIIQNNKKDKKKMESIQNNKKDKKKDGINSKQQEG